MLLDCLFLELALVEFQGVLHISSKGLYEGGQADIASVHWRELGLVL